ncbi:Hypothetical protein Cul210931_0989 [Corynebacterium ulcerans]|uniref:DUF368 domain-containing protein n=1 Tax=Corynebacterium ulcerans TaxID=65058 RepID=UPI0005210ECC|nr:DUF368 domain-containing protein [Corynebacterium ulcerans]AIU30338.1 Hypothetical protein Cul210931_0989 [Corynebacterium ulcerans]AIU91630.1 Hypothetical protein Cul05146_1056 [Corynebacterium ulcerans]MBH5301761.1 DUF368 domain-containing protein [Corynebacterium ulcerans]NOL61892.1 DUF368 domain-containing protein [Corynebacterium ulcerans]NON17470.1 DUF368 domain-containing protein [Corynebacterium ulcerans]
MAATPQATTRSSSFSGSIVHVIAGGLIGLAEMVPGVSGGTVALVVGIYERAIHNGHSLLHLVRTMFTNPSGLKEAARRVEWLFLACVGFGMVATVLLLSSVMHNFVENHGQSARALFLGMVAVSITVPLLMISRKDYSQKRVAIIAAFIIAAILTFIGTGFTSEEKTDPSLVVIFFAAAIAVCALVLPGISGSFILLSLGLYAPVIGAVSDRNLTVMAVFALGALTGIACFIKILDYLITVHRTITLATMAGLMLGSLRALWPWQDMSGSPAAPSGNIGMTILLILVGGGIVAAIMLIERRFNTKPSTESENA